MRTYQHTTLADLIDMIHFTVDAKATPATVQGVGVEI
jgi:hypothetical protein